MADPISLYRYKLLESSGSISEGKAFARSFRDLNESFNGMVVKCNKCKFNIKDLKGSFTVPFLKNLHQLLKNKIELMTALLITKCLFHDIERQAIVDFIIRKIMAGCPLSEAFACFESAFDKFTIKAVEIAERTGRLPIVVEKTAERLNASLTVKKKVRNATVYPAVLLVFVSAVILFWLAFVVPRFAELFSDIGASISGLTSSIIALSAFGNSHPYLSVTLFLSPAPLLFLLSKSRIFMRYIPIFGIIQRELFVMNFFYCMSIVAQERCNLLEGIDCLGDISGSEIIRKVGVLIRDGNNLSTAMRQTRMFKEYEIAIVEAGEKSGDLASAFQSASSVSHAKLSDRLERMTGLIQPVTIALVGLLLLLVAYSIITPIYSSIDLTTMQ
jgi:type II secretory pathway component PulF